MKQKPTLTTVPGRKALDVNVLVALFKKMTGRDPTPDEIADAKRKLAAHGGAK